MMYQIMQEFNYPICMTFTLSYDAPLDAALNMSVVRTKIHELATTLTDQPTPIFTILLRQSVIFLPDEETATILRLMC